MKHLLLCLLCLVSLGPANAQPNVLVISIDDLNDWVGCLGGHPQAHTPNIDRLAERGTLFTNAYCQAPVCTPSRAAMITGLSPARTGLYFLQPGLEASPIARDQPHLMETFAKAGYKTMGAGKFVHGTEDAYYQEYGGRFGGFGPIPKEKVNYQEGIKLWDWGAYPATDAEMPDWQVADWVIDKLGTDQEQPFFLVAGFWRPHVPMYAPQAWHDLFPLEQIRLPEVIAGDRDDLPAYAKDLTSGEPAPRHEWFLENGEWKSAVQSYLASVAFVDSQVGRVLDALDASPFAEDTIVVLLSDHGWHLGEKERWAKRSLWTDGTHVPLIIQAPGFEAGQRCQEPAGLIDLYPTLLELAGIEDEVELDGQSLAPQLQNPETPKAGPVLCTFGPGNHSLHDRRWHYIRYNDGSEELYDLQEDPHEWKNLAGEPDQESRIQSFQKHLPGSNAELLRAENWNTWELMSWENAEKNAQSKNSN